MLNFIRSKASSWIIKFILGLIILVFIFFGWGAMKSGKINQVAKVNGVTITLQEYKQSYNMVVNHYRSMYGQGITPQMLKLLQVERQALETLIEQILLEEKAKTLGFKISDMELTDYIANMEFFLTNGKFDYDKYQSILAANRMSVEDFENQVRRQIVKEKITELITGTAKVTDKELREWYNFNNKTIDIKYASFVPDKYKKEDFKLSEKEIDEYYEENKENYKSKEKVKVVYARFSADDYKKDADVKEEEIKAYYQENIESYKTPEMVKARHILIKLSNNATEKEIEDAKKVILNVKAKIGEKLSFADAAKKYSQGPSNVTGGDLGEFKRGDMVKPFEDKAFLMKPGEISEPVKTRFGWHLINVEKKSEEGIKDLADVKESIKELLALKKAKEVTYDKANFVYQETLKGNSLKDEEKAGSLKLIETDYFTQTGPDKGVIDPGNFAKEAFSFDVGDTSGLIEAGNNIYILQVIDKKEPKTLPLQDVEEKVKDILIAKKQEEKAKNDADQFLKDVIAVKTIDAKSATKPTELKIVKELKRKGNVEGFGTLPKVQTAVFELASKDEKISEKVIKTNKGFYIFEIKNVNEPTDKGFDEKKEEIKKGLLARKKNHLYRSWINDLKESAQIIRSEQFTNI